MRYFIKLCKIFYYLIYNFFLNSISFLLVKYDLYFSIFFKLYINKSYNYFKKEDSQNLEKINKKILFRLIRNNKYLDLFAPLYHQSEDYKFGWELCKLKFVSQETINKIFEFDQKILFTPKTFGKFGHSLLIDIFIRGQLTNILEKKEIIIAGNKKFFSNYKILKQLFSKNVNFQPNFLNTSVNKKIYDNCEVNLNYFKTQSGEYLDLRKYFFKMQLEWEKKNFENYIKIEKTDEKRGLDFLKKYLIDLYKNWYVLISVRENEDTFELRNSIFESYIPAIYEITKRGGFVIRYGNLSGQIKKTNIKNFLDLRGNEELNQNLPFLVKNAKFQISTGTGTSVLPMLLDTPNLITNWSPIIHVMGTKKDILLPKMFFNSRGKVVNFQDRLSDKFGSVETSYMANKLQLGLKDNSEQDINLAVTQMFEKCDNKNFKTRENQNKFKNIMIKNNFYPIEISNSLEQTYPEFFYEN